MATVADVARAFARGEKARCHNARTNGNEYFLHGHRIAWREPDGAVMGDWCGWHTPTTANHLRHIRDAIGSRASTSYAIARDDGIRAFPFNV